MSTELAIVRLNAAQSADTPEERVGHLTAALANVKEALKAASVLIADADPRQVPLDFVAAAPVRGAEITVDTDGVVYTTADTVPAAPDDNPKPYRDPVHETIVINFLRRETVGHTYTYDADGGFATRLEDRDGVLAVKTKTIAEYTGLEEGVVSRILVRLRDEGLHVVSPKRGWWRAAGETEHTFAHGDAADFRADVPDDTKEYDDDGRASEWGGPTEDELASPPEEDFRADGGKDDNEEESAAGVRLLAPEELKDILRDYIEGRRDEGASDPEIAEEIRSFDTAPVGAL